MGLTALILGAVGVVADVSDATQAVHWLISRDKHCAADQLFKRSFGHAVKQFTERLGHFCHPPGPANVEIDDENLSRTVAKLDRNFVAENLPRDVEKLAQLLAPEFRHCIIIPNHQLPDDDFDQQTQKVLELAIQHFIIELPAHATAFQGVALASIFGTSREHQSQSEKLDQLLQLLQTIRDTQERLEREKPQLDATTIQLESVRPEFRNPFRIVTAENFDHDYRSLAQLFTQPSDYQNVRSHDNLLIEGGRGCGKSMILKSMAAIPAVEIERLRRGKNGAAPTHLSFEESGIDYFGVYIKLFRGYFSEYTPDSKLTEEAAHVYFQHYFNMILLRSLLEALQDAQEHGLFSVVNHVQRQMVEEVASIAGWTLTEVSLVGLIRQIRSEENRVGQYITKLRLSLERSNYEGTFTTVDTFLRDCCTEICKALPPLNGRRIYFLLDEFENLAGFQQKVANTLAKLRPISLSLKIATRAGGLKCMENLQGDAMQFPRDYQYVCLDYDFRNKDYQRLLSEIGKRRLNAEGFAVHELVELLETAPHHHPASASEVSAALSKLLQESGHESLTMTPEQLKEKQHQWNDALVHRLNRNRQKPITYAGFESFVHLSSGIISNFIELCKMTFYMAEWEAVDVRMGTKISWRIQNEAAYKISKASFDWIPRNIAETGPTISRLVSDLGDIFREKLLWHTSEPESARVTLRDPQSLENPGFDPLVVVLDDALRWSVLQTPGLAKAYLPKHRSDVRPNEYYLNRILIPHLRISANFRWPTQFSVADLAALIDQKARIRKRNDLIKRISGTSRRNGKTKSDASAKHPDLFQKQ